LTQLEFKIKTLTRIRKMTNELLSCGAYSTKNMEEQFNNFDKLKVPEWEKDIIARAWNFKKKESHKLLKELDQLLKDVNNT